MLRKFFNHYMINRTVLRIKNITFKINTHFYFLINKYVYM